MKLISLFHQCLVVVTICSPLLQAAPPGDSGALAQSLLKRAEMTRGVCAVLGGDGDLPVALAKAGGLLVHVREPEAGGVDALRAAADRAGFDIQRLAVERGSLDRLPYAENSVDLVVSTRADAAFLKALTAGEVLRALRPEGTAIIGGASADAVALGEWARAGNGERVATWSDAHGAWVQFFKPVLKGAADWSHWEKSPDNNPVSDDAVIKAPYMTQFMATPYYIGMPAVTTAAGGRTFLAVGHIAHHEREWPSLGRVVARGGYNGAVLWERKLPEGYLVHRSAFIATKDTFYMIDGSRCLLLDPRTGSEKSEIRIPGVDGDLKWIALKDGVLYAMSGPTDPPAETVKGDRAMGGWSWADLSKLYYEKRIPHGYGDVIAAYRLDDKYVIWKHREETPIDSRGLAILDDRMFLYCPDKHLRSLSITSGSVGWTNDDAETLKLIEQPGKGLISTPGWRTETMVVATPKALVIQGQTHMNVVAVSTENGKQLWQKQKVTNNPNAMFVDGKVIVGVGPGGRNVALDPISGAQVEDLGFTKRACTRLTASTDSFFCRGEGMIRFDRDTRQVTVDGAARPGCNDGVIPANGLIYLGPWSCDCNLSIIGAIARCSAGDFKFDHRATSARLEKSPGADEVKPLPITERDWPTYRGNNHRSGSTPVRVGAVAQQWHYQPVRTNVPTEATAAGGLIFFGGEDGRARAVDAETGELRWAFPTAGIVKYPPTIADGRAFFGSGDGHVYCLEAATGRLLWRFRAAPVERHLMIYGAMSSTWPVNTGVLVHEGVAYFAAGIVDHDGTYIYALDAKTGDLRWQNISSGHLNAAQRKGVSAQGNLTVHGKSLLLAGGNVISPAGFDLKTGECLEKARDQNQPQANGGKFVGVFGADYVLGGGRILYSSPLNVETKGSFALWSADRRSQTLNYGGIPPVWNDQMLAVINFKYGNIAAFDTPRLTEALARGLQPPTDRGGQFQNNLVTVMSVRKEDRWLSRLTNANKFEAVSLALTPNAVLAVARYQDLTRARPLWFLIALAPEDGRTMFQHELPGDPLPDGLLVDRDGRIVISLVNGGLVSFAPRARQAGL